MLEFIKDNRDSVLFIAMCLSFLETWITGIGVKRFGPEIESSIPQRFLLRWFGLSGLAAFWCAFWLIIWFWFKPGPYFSVFLLVYCFVLNVNNVIVLRALHAKAEQA